MKLSKLVFSAVIALTAVSAAAHHGWSGYDAKLLTLNGTIERSSYTNPHGSIALKTADKTWNVVLAPVARMESRGLTQAMIAPGATVTVEGYAHLKDAGELRAERITIAGKSVELR